jgi:hypothetical protein
MIKIEIEVKDIDYDSLIEQYLPMMTERLRRSNNPVASLLSNGMPASMAKSILKKLPPAKKDQLTAELINANRDQLVRLLLDLAQQNKIKADVAALKAKAENI